MKINGVPVTRSEFEYSYNKNNSADVIDRKTVDEYVDLFVNYKLKVAAALDAQLDTLSSFRREFALYRDQEVRPAFVDSTDMLAEAKAVYERTKEHIGPRGLIKPAHILMYVEQKASEDKHEEAHRRADSLYNVLKAGADLPNSHASIRKTPVRRRTAVSCRGFSRDRLSRSLRTRRMPCSRAR